MSPGRFIRYLRMKKAAAFLEVNNASVTRVATGVGFTNLSYFSKCFREEFGLSPSAYSRQLQNKSEASDIQHCE
jgi:transcriptional regulator GlxA family with amidase domain